MNRCVPDSEMEDDYSIPSSSASNRLRKSPLPDDEIMELLWQNGQVVKQSQKQRPSLHNKKSSQAPSKYDAVLPEDRDIPRPQPHPTAQNHQLFMHEDEMASWLQYPLVDDPFCADLLYPDSSTVHQTNTTAAAELRPNPISAPPSKPPIHPPRRTELQNFLHFSRTNNNKARVSETAPSSSKSVVRESTTVVDSCDTPLVGHSSRALDSGLDGGGGGGGGVTAGAAMSFATGATANAATSFPVKEIMTCEMSLTSSPGGSSASASASAEPMSSQKPRAGEDRKRKGREAEDDGEFQSEVDVEFESANGKKQARGSTSTKRSRAAEVHNLSERRRRDRINEKMKALQELIPRCNKSDKASMLDEAIEYLKSLQLQVQMMSMGCGMVPMMFPGVQQYMPMGMGMGMGMEMAGMTQPMMPFPNVLAGSSMPTAAAHLGPRFPMPPFHMQPIPANDPARVQATNQSDQMLNALAAQNPNQSRMPNFADPYQQFFNPQQMQLPLQQNQAMAQPSSKPSSSKGPETHENHQSG